MRRAVSLRLNSVSPLAAPADASYFCGLSISVAWVSAAHPGLPLGVLKSKPFRRWLRQLMRGTFGAPKVPKSAARTSPPGLRPGALRCSRLAGSVVLAAVAYAPSAQTCDSPLSASRSAPPAALTAGQVKGQPEPPTRHCSTPALRTRSRVSLSIETKIRPRHRTERWLSGFGCRVGFDLEDLKGAEKRRACPGLDPGGKCACHDNRTAACLSGRSEASSAGPTCTEHRRACPGLDPGEPNRRPGAIAGKEFLVTLVMTIVDTKVTRISWRSQRRNAFLITHETQPQSVFL
jgi:hypothetical protein